MALEILAEFAAPGRGPAGLAWDGRSLWHSDFREGTIYRLSDQADVLDSLWCPGLLSGLTWDGRYLWQALLDEGIVRSIDPATTDFDQTLDLKAHGLLSGLAWDGAGLRVVAQQTGDILTVDPLSGHIHSALSGPVAIGDIDHHRDALWLSVATPMIYSEAAGFEWLDDPPQYTILQLDPADGREIGLHAAERLYTGLAWDSNDNLWLASTVERRIYRARIIPDAV